MDPNNNSQHLPVADPQQQTSLPPRQTVTDTQAQYRENTKKRNQKLIVAYTAVLMLLLLGGTLFATGVLPNPFKQNIVSTQQETNEQTKDEIEVVQYDPDAHPRDLELTADDQQRYYDMFSISLMDVAFKSHYGHNYRSAQDISDFIYRADARAEPRVDPGTNEPYVFTDNAPKRGEMQFKPAHYCEDNLRDIGEPATTDSINAFMVMMDDGSYLCKSNVQ